MTRLTNAERQLREITETLRHQPSAIIFDLPLPPRGCSSNGDKGSWRKKHAAGKVYRQEGWAYSRNAAIAAHWLTPDRVRLSLVFGTRGVRLSGRYAPRDVSNAIAAFKAAQDGLVDAGLMFDDSAKHCELGTVTIDSRCGPFVRVTLEAL